MFRRCWMFRVPECYLTCSSTCCSCHFKEVLCCECAILALLFCLGNTVDFVWQHRVWEMFPGPTCFLPFRKHQTNASELGFSQLPQPTKASKRAFSRIRRFHRAIDYPFSHNPGSGKYWGDPFFTSMSMGGRL